MPGSKLAGLLFISNNDGPTPGLGGQLTLIDLATLRQVTITTGGTRGANLRATADGRVFLSQSHQIDVLSLITLPRVIDTNPPADAVAALPLDSISVTFDHDMLINDASFSGSVLNPANYALRGETVGDVPIRAVAYDAATRTAYLRLPSATAACPPRRPPR